MSTTAERETAVAGHDPEPSPDQSETREEQPLLLSADDAARLCRVSKRTWRRLDAAGKVPQAVRLGGRKLWRRQEVLDFVRAGCPGRAEWDWTPEDR